VPLEIKSQGETGRKISMFSEQMGYEICMGEVEQPQSDLGRVYNAIFNSVKEISMHLRYSTGMPRF